MEKIRILITDDHKVLRDGLRAFLEEHPSFEVVGEADSGEKAIALATQLIPDLVLMDINMDGMDGIEATKAILEKNPTIRVLGLTMVTSGTHIKQMLEAGAKGYLLKNSGKEEVFRAIETIAKGGTYFSSEVTQRVMEQFIHPQKEKSNPGKIPLSSRELEVLELIVKQLSNQEIADKLFISPRTVEAHKRNLLEKTGAKNVAGLVVYVVNNQLFDL